MMKELVIYPKKCKEQVSQLEQIKSNLVKYKSRIQGVKNVINSFDGAEYSTILSVLNTIIEDVEREGENINSLKEVLEKSNQLYMRAELKISDIFNRITNGINTVNEEVREQYYDLLPEELKNM